MNLDRIPKPGTTNDRKRFWDKARNVVLGLQKKPGRNVSVDEREGLGTVINVTRERGTAPPGCADCVRPSLDCPHAVCSEFILDSEDTSNRDLIEINGGSNQIGFYYGLDGFFHLYVNATDTLQVATASPYDTWHFVRIYISRVDDDNIHIKLTVDGANAEDDFAWTGGDTTENIRVGALQGDSNTVHRRFKCVTAFGNIDKGEPNFLFPPDSFDSFTSGVSIDGDGFLLVQHGAVAVDDYAEKAISYNLSCLCCPRDCTEINVFQMTIGGTATKSHPESGCDAWSLSHSKTWTLTRIPQAETFDPDGYQFKLYTEVDPDIEGCCSLVFLGHFPFAVGGSTPHDEIPCDPGPGDQVKVETLDAFWGMQISYDESCSPDESTTNALIIAPAIRAKFTAYNCDGCPQQSCEINYNSGHEISVHSTLCDVSNFIGTYSASNECDDGSGNITTVNIELKFLAA